MDRNILPPGLAGYVMAQQQGQHNSMNQIQQLGGLLQMQGALEQRQQAQQQAQQLQSLIPQLTDPAAQLMARSGDLRGAIARQYPQRKLQTVGNTIVDVTGEQPKEVFTAKPLPKEPTESSLAKLTRERDALPPGHPQRAQYDAALTKMTTHAPAPSANVTIRQETEFGKKVGGQLGEMYSDLLKSDLAAPSTISKYTRLGNLLSQVNTGKFTGTTVDLKAAAKGLGFDLNAMGIADNIAPAQAARALSNTLALELRNPAGGAGMPGALSDKDREFLVQSIPGLENDPGAVGKMIEYRVKVAQREQQVARMARDYRRKNGKFDEGFFDELAEWSNKNPLFPQAAAATPASAPAGRWAIRPAGR
jgi:hypothetical protein